MNKELNTINNKIVEETENYIIKKNDDGTFKKEMKYKKLITHLPNSEDEEIELYKILNATEDNNNVIELKEMIGREVNIEKAYLIPYDSFDDKTGETTTGVTSIFSDTNGVFYATSSKTVYYNLLNFFKTFGLPETSKYKSIIFDVVGTKKSRGTQISLSLKQIVR